MLQELKQLLKASNEPLHIKVGNADFDRLQDEIKEDAKNEMLVPTNWCECTIETVKCETFAFRLAVGKP